MYKLKPNETEKVAASDDETDDNVVFRLPFLIKIKMIVETANKSKRTLIMIVPVFINSFFFL